jgi:hypothetical protein
MSSERKIVGIDPVIIKANDMGYKLFKTKVREDHSYYSHQEELCYRGLLIYLNSRYV